VLVTLPKDTVTLVGAVPDVRLQAKAWKGLKVFDDHVPADTMLDHESAGPEELSLTLIVALLLV
jgi:hypothetical protein